MKKFTILLSLVVLFVASCTKSESETQVSNVNWTPCVQNLLKSGGASGNVDVEFTSNGVQITFYNFEVPCDFSTVNVTHNLVNGVLNIKQQGFPDQANCICYTNASYTISGISQDDVNVIFINGEQIYCYNNKQLVDWTNNTTELRIHNKKKISITEGIWGTLVKTEGNCQPIVNDDFCKQYPVKREILIYEYTKMNETSHEFTHFLEIYTKLVATTICDEEGFFEFALEPGKYSVFIREGEYLYANLFEGDGGIESITVESSNVSEKFLNLDYADY